MSNYADFMLNEMVGLAGLDDGDTADILKKIEELREAEPAPATNSVAAYLA